MIEGASYRYPKRAWPHGPTAGWEAPRQWAQGFVVLLYVLPDHEWAVKPLGGRSKRNR